MLKKLFKAITKGNYSPIYRIRLWLRLRNLSSGLGYRFTVHHQKNKADLVSSLCDKYGSDKGEIRTSGHPYSWPSHTYADFYSRLFFHCRKHVRKVFECGLGTNNTAFTSTMGANGKPGASLRVWRDYFPNASIYGADIDESVLFEEERIRTFYIDQLDPQAIRAYWDQVGERDFDFMLDDGLHTFEAGACLFTHSIDYLAEDGIYIIEDVHMTDLLSFKAFFSKTAYAVDYVTLFRPNAPLGRNNLVVIRKTS